MKTPLFSKALLGLSALSLVACQTAPIAPPMFNRAPAAGFQRFNAPQTQNLQVVELRWQSREQIVEAAAAGLDLWGAQPDQKRAKARVTPEQEAFLRQLGMQVSPSIEAQMDTRGGLPSGYMHYDEMVAKLKAMAQKYPQLVTLEDVGDTHLKTTGRAPTHDIWAISLTNKQKAGQKPTLMLTAGVHARELAPVEMVMKLADEMTSQYGSDPEVTRLMDTRELVILPMVNVDGRVEVQKGDTWKRKNMNSQRGDGVDLNRNFDAAWNYEGMDVPSSWKRGLTNPWGQTYSGPSAASEVETQTVQSMYTRKKITASMDIHAYGEMFFWPRGYQRAPIPEAATYRQVWQDTFGGNNRYKGGTSLELLYPTCGTTDDYGYDKHGAFSMGLEVGKSFRPSWREVEVMWTNTRASWLGLLDATGKLAELQAQPGFVQQRARRVPVQAAHFHRH